MVCTIGFIIHGTGVKMKPGQYEVTLKICNKVVCNNVYASVCVYFWLKTNCYSMNSLMTDFMLYNA